ncbi:MAG: amidohydrolase, partial [Gemmatimonadota bacterium]
MIRRSFSLLVLAALLASSPLLAQSPSTANSAKPTPVLVAGAVSKPNADPFPSTYTPFPSRPTLIRNVHIFTATGPLIRNGAVLMQNGKIAAIGQSITAPANAVVIDGEGKFVTPGLIDTHSHLGVYPAPGTAAHSDGNEATAPVTAHVWAEHSVWPQDPQFPRNLAGGTTTLQVLPGSANLIGGRSV